MGAVKLIDKMLANGSLPVGHRRERIGMDKDGQVVDGGIKILYDAIHHSTHHQLTLDICNVGSLLYE